MRSLFVRVFVTFWVASALMLLGLSVVTAITNARPLSHRWLVHSLDLYARTSMDAYELGGNARLAEYLNEIREESDISAFLLQDDRPLAAMQIPPDLMPIVSEARNKERSQYSFGRPWLGVVRQVRNGHTYLFAAEVRPVRMFGNFIDPEVGPFRLLVLAFISATLCGLLARSITKPIRTLQAAARSIAEGDLTARASPTIGARQDELASLARDFDRMADRVQSLLDQQKLLLRDISHELRSPLARLSLSAELIQRGDTTAAARMQTDIESLERMIADLLTLARIDASEKSSRRDSVHLGRLIQQIVRDANFEGAATGKTVVQTGSMDCCITGDAGLLHSCIENVVRNAVKHTPPETIVEVSTHESSGIDQLGVCITVTDEGSGVPDFALKQIFDPFFRIASADPHRQGGAGLGLSISRRIVVLYGGEITAKNIPGGGLLVELRFPGAYQEAPSL